MGVECQPTRFTVKIFGEGLTEWYYLDKLRSKKIFSFTLDPGLPVKSRSSYKKRLLLIDKELDKHEQERADLLILITDLDNIVIDPAQLREYLADKARYEARGVVFIESHPSIELWFLYHFMPRFEKTAYFTCEETILPLRKFLPGYEKSKAYYSGNTRFRDTIIESYPHRIGAAACAHSSCRYPATAGEISNFTNLHRLILFLHMLQIYYVFSDILHSKIHKAFVLNLETKGIDSLSISLDGNHLLLLKSDRNQIMCYSDNAPVEIPLEFKYSECSRDLKTVIDSLEQTIRQILGE